MMLSDVVMPRKDGLSLLEDLRHQQDFPTIVTCPKTYATYNWVAKRPLPA
jgi:YesN/AraC family two-component response regulator